MALSLSSPCGCPYDEDEELAVLESTAAEHGGPARPRLPEISVISPGLDVKKSVMEQNHHVKPAVVTQGSCDDTNTERVKVFLRIKPLTEVERGRGEEQGCVGVQDEETLLLNAPKDSQNMRTAERGITHSMHKFIFSKILKPETTQQQVYECMMKKMVSEVLQGENRLLYTYGVTNSGKTYTIYGSGQEAGLLPRALVSLFRKLQGRLHGAMDLKPVMYRDVRQLAASEIRVEEIRRNSLLKEEENLNRRGGTTTVWDSGIGGLSSTSNTLTQLGDMDSFFLEPDSLSSSGEDNLEEGLQFSVWVSFYEIYNEFLYDLLDASPSMYPRKRITLRLSDDKQGNPYVKDLSWIQVRSAEEAWRIVRVGRRNQSFASTHHNQNSSRSHSIFSIRVLHIHPEANSVPVMHISELTVCDLAGSERCKDQQTGERMKEANNINTSLLTLGRCIAALRHNQSNKTRPPQVVPFRDSKLTRVLQGFFCGQGTSSMVVNITPCASVYDETLQALKFSAIATQLIHGPSTKTRVADILSLLQAASGHESTVMEEEENEGDDEDGDVTMFDNEALLQAINVLKRVVQRQRADMLALEANVREEVVSEMMGVMSSMKDSYRESSEVERAIIEERCEDRIKILQTHLKAFYSQQLEEKDDEIEALTAELEKTKDIQSVPAAVPQRDSVAPRRSQRLMTQSDQSALRVELTQCNSELLAKTQELSQCRSELLAKTQELTNLKMQLSVPGTLTNSADRKLEEGQRNLRQLRLDLQRLGMGLQSGERACCRNTGGERLRQALVSADETLAKQDQILVELQNGLTLVKAGLRRNAGGLAQIHVGQPQLPPPGSTATPGSCKKRGCGAPSDENRPPPKRPFFTSLFPIRTPTHKYNTRNAEEAKETPSSRILRSRQQTPPASPAPTPRLLRGKY